MSGQKELLHSFLEEWHKGEGITVRTSGSTGFPKSIVLPQTQIERSARRSNNFFGLSRKSHLHSAISFEYIGGKMMIARALMAGCNLTFSEPSLQITLPKCTENITLMAVVPAQMPYILNNLVQFSVVKTFLIGGSEIDDKLWDRISSSGIDARQTYGMTETASHIAIRRIVGNSQRRPRFVPMSGIKVLSDSDKCLHIIDDDIAVTTNDIADLFPDGSFEILGRRDDVIITGGLKVLPQYIESLLRDSVSPICPEFFISSLPDEVWSSRIILVAVSDQTDNIQRDKTISSLRHAVDSIPLEVLPKKFRPKEIILVPRLPLTESGKLMRKFRPHW